MHRITIFCGNYGSGKTEISLNTAIKYAKENKKTTLVDLDIVNPYFRSSEQTELLNKHGVRVLCPTFANTAVDIPSLPASIQSIFADKDQRVIIDVGGDATGATALGRYKHFLDADDYVTYMVINARRPFSKGTDELSVMLEDIQLKARLKVDFLINNTNMALNTTVDDLIFGHKIIEKLSDKYSIPLKYISGKPEILSHLPESITTERLPINIYMRPDWLDDTL